MGYFETDGNGLVFRENGETVMISPYGTNSLRVRAAFIGDIEEGENALIPVAEEKSEIEISERNATIRCGKIIAKCFVQEWGNALRISFYNQKGELLLREIGDGGALTLKAREFKPLAGGKYRLKASFSSDRNEKIYGMGQYQQEIFDLKGCNLELAHRNSQASIPFYLSSLGYGFLWNNPAIGEVHFGLNTTEWIAECTGRLDYWITAGDTPAEIEEQYSLVTGRAPVMPEYGLGFWQCKLRYYYQQEVVDVAENYKKRGITPDVIVIDYYHWPRCGDWRFDEEYFPEPTKMVSSLKDMGIETMVSVWPQVDWRSENYEEMKRKGLLVKINSGVDAQMIFHGNNVFMDATNPRTRDYVWEKCKKNYYDSGIKTFWLDEAEPEFTGYAYENYRYHAGSVLEVGNIYPREYSRLFYEGQLSCGQKDIINLVRCAWAGSQRYGALVWSGDIFSTYEDFRKQICVGIHMGIAGIPWWTTDIGGFHGGKVDSPDFKELLIRWFEYGAFCPVMRLHGMRLPGKDIIDKSGEKREWTGADNEIWSYGPEAERIFTKYIRLRETLRPYTRRIMLEAHEKGAPVIRPLFYGFPDDRDCWNIGDEYLYGDNILVAPVCHRHDLKRKVYLPKGAFWISVADSKRYEGGTEIEADAPIDVIPVFLRDGKEEYLIGKI